MDIAELRSRNFETEFVFSTSRSSGPGGQHVNKTETKVELRFCILESLILSEEEKKLLLDRLVIKITDHGEIIITSQETRSQIKNKEIATEKFYEILAEALKLVKERKKRKISRIAKAKRLEEKKRQSDKKNLRKGPDFIDE